MDDRGGFGRPEVFEAAEVGVLAASEESVKVFRENRKVAVGVVDASVVMVRHRDGKRDLHFRTLGSQGQAVDEGVVGAFIGAQKEAPLGTAARNHVVAA